MLRLARNAGTEAEAHTALTLALTLMYAHEIRDQELLEPDGLQPMGDAVVDRGAMARPSRRVSRLGTRTRLSGDNCPSQPNGSKPVKRPRE